MDKLIYLASSGAEQAMLAQQINANNLANLNSPAFKADLAKFKSQEITGDGYNSRVMVLSEESGTDFSPGALIPTGNDLDVAINGKGFFTVEDQNGQEAYTRFSSLKVNPERLLTTVNDLPVLGQGGPITIPPFSKLEVGIDGSISIVPESSSDGTTVYIDRLKLTNPEPLNLQKSVNGLFKTKDGTTLEADSSVTVSTGFIEGSNVNAVESMTNMINLARQYEINMKLMQAAKENDQSAASILRIA